MVVAGMGNATGSYSTAQFVAGAAAASTHRSLLLRSLTGLPRSSSVEALYRRNGRHDIAELDVFIAGTSYRGVGGVAQW